MTPDRNAFAAEDARVTQIIESSILFRFADRVVRRIETAWQTSATAQQAARLLALVKPLPVNQKRMSAGILILTAAVTHVTLMFLSGPPASWLWLILPGLAAAVGVVLMLSAPVESTA